MAALCGKEDGALWAETPGFGLTAAQGKAIADGFKDGGAGLRSTGIMIGEIKFMFIRADDEMMNGKKGQDGVNILMASTCFLIGTFDENMTSGKNSMEVGKMADYLKEAGY